MKGKIKTFSDKKEFVTSRLTLKTEKQKTCTKNTISNKVNFRKEGEIKSFLDKNKNKTTITTKT